MTPLGDALERAIREHGSWPEQERIVTSWILIVETVDDTGQRWHGHYIGPDEPDPPRWVLRGLLEETLDDLRIASETARHLSADDDDE